MKYPSFPSSRAPTGDPVFALSQLAPVYQPALREAPTSWLLFLKLTGGAYSAQDSDNLMNGPGNFAIDEKGFVWVDDNAVPQPPDEFACAGRRLLKFYPWGEPFPGAPYLGGGLSGAGYGITLDPSGTHDLDPDDLPADAAWPHVLLLIWEWHTGIEEEQGEPERGPVWLFAEMKDGSRNEYPTALPVYGYASPAAIVEAARKVIDRSIGAGHFFNGGQAAWDGGIIGDSWERADELNGDWPSRLA